MTATASALKVQGGKLVGIVTERGEIACEAAVVAAGARSKALAASVGDKLPLETERGYHVAIEDPGTGPRTSIMASDAKMVVNWTDEGLRAAGTVEIAGLDAPPNWKRAEILRDHLFGMFPKLAKDIPSSRIKTWFGHRPSMPDGRPCIGYARASKDIVYAFGHGHVGLVGSARTGRVVAQLLSGREPEIPLAPFSPDRFL